MLSLAMPKSSGPFPGGPRDGEAEDGLGRISSASGVLSEQRACLKQKERDKTDDKLGRTLEFN